LYTLLSAQHKT